MVLRREIRLQCFRILMIEVKNQKFKNVRLRVNLLIDQVINNQMISKNKWKNSIK